MDQVACPTQAIFGGIDENYPTSCKNVFGDKSKFV